MISHKIYRSNKFVVISFYRNDYYHDFLELEEKLFIL